MIRGLALCAALTAAPALAVDAGSVLPYREFDGVVDGDAGEWRAPWLERTFAETLGTPAQRNRVRVRAVWDLDALWLAIEVDDADPIGAPAALTADQFHQYDSMQIYIDPAGDSAAAMDRNDVDILLLPDGRVGVLRGDELVAALTQARVPQRETVPLPVDYAVGPRAGGWSLELCVPFAALGIAPEAGHGMRVDVAMNDWLVAHAPGAPTALTIERIRDDALITPPSPDPAVGELVLPLTWTGERDFGYPQRWPTFELQGGPPLVERMVRRYGGARVVAASISSVAAIALLALVAQAVLARRRLRAVLARLADTDPIEPATAASAGEREPASTAATVPTVDEPAAMQPPAPIDMRDRAFAERVLAWIRAHLDATLTPATLAAEFHVSVRTLQRRLRDGLDSSPQDLILAARLDAARALLERGDLRVSEVAYRVGFDDVSHFSRRFRAAYGMPPSAVRPPHR